VAFPVVAILVGTATRIAGTRAQATDKRQAAARSDNSHIAAGRAGAKDFSKPRQLVRPAAGLAGAPATKAAMVRCLGVSLDGCLSAHDASISGTCSTGTGGLNR
jgi:hypothetical protein